MLPSASGTPPAYQRWESGRRFYEVRTITDLFGQHTLHRAWGGKGRRSGGTQTCAVGGSEELARAWSQIARERAARGYFLVQAS